jgi:hypothetical protein
MKGFCPVGKKFLPTENPEHMSLKREKIPMMSEVFARRMRPMQSKLMVNLQNFFVSSNLFSRCPIRIAPRRDHR